MPYIGRSLGDGVRARYIYAATSGQTTFSGNDANGIALAYSDTLYMDVYQNGVLLKPVTDYASTTGTSVVLVTGASADDVLEMIVYDSFAVADTVSAVNGGTFSGTVSMSDDLTVDSGTLFVDASTNRVGVGTTSPDHTLTVSASSSPVIEIEQTSGGPYKANIVLSGNDTEFRGSSGNIEFYTGNDDGASSTERMRIDSSGTVLVGTTDTSPFNNTSTVGTTIAGGELQLASVNGEAAYFNRSGSDGRVINIRRAGTFIGGIDVSTTQVTYNQTSDYRLKENVSYTWDATARLKQLKPARFNYIVDADNTVDGFLAHEVESIVPQAISGAKDAIDADGNIDPQCIDHSKLVPLLVKTIQELEARITALEAEDE